MAMTSRDKVNPDSASHFTASGPQTNIRNPLPLSASQEAEVKSLYYKRVRSRCAPEIKEFAECAKGRTVTATWHCRAQRFAMNSCMISHATVVEEDAARQEWFAGVTERRQKKEQELEEVEKRREEVIVMTRRQEEKEKLLKEEEKLLKEEEERRKLAETTGPKEKKKSSWWG